MMKSWCLLILTWHVCHASYSYKERLNDMDVISLSQTRVFLHKSNQIANLTNTMNQYLENPPSLQQLKQCLLVSFVLQSDVHALYKLAGFHLFGFPTPDPSEDTVDDVCQAHIENARVVQFREGFRETPLVLEQDHERALNYYCLAHYHGHPEAAFFLIYLLRQSLLSQRFAQLFEEVSLVARIRELMNSGMLQQSSFMKAYIFEAGRRCLVQEELFDFDDEDELRQDLEQTFRGCEHDVCDRQNYTVQGFAEACNLTDSLTLDSQVIDDGFGCPTCQQLLSLGLHSAEEVLAHLQERGGVVPQVANFDEIKANSDTNRESIEVLKQQADLGDVEAQLHLAELHFFGNVNMGVHEDQAIARRYFEQAAEQNDPHALYNLGIMETQSTTLKSHQENNSNHSLARNYFEQAAQQGSAEGYSGLAYMYMNGMGVEVNATHAAQLFEKSAKMGSKQSLANAAILYLQGEGLPKNMTKAIELFKQSAEFGLETAQFNLILLFLQGEAVNTTCSTLLGYLSDIMQSGRYVKYAEKAVRRYHDHDYWSARLYIDLAQMLGIRGHDENLIDLWGWERDDCVHEDCELVASLQAGTLGELVSDAADRLYESERYDLAAQLYVLASSNSPYSLYKLSYMADQGQGLRANRTRALQINEALIQMAWSDRFERVHLIPAYLHKLRMWLL